MLVAHRITGVVSAATDAGGRAFLDHLLRWLRLIWTWAFRDPRLVWLTLGALAAAMLPVWWWKSEPAFRITGMALQLLGLGTVTWGIRKTRELFGRPSMRRRFVEWWRGRPRRRHTISGSAGIALEHSSMTGDAEEWSQTSRDDYMEVRLAALEVRGRFNAFAQKTRTELSKHTDDLSQETRVRSDADKAISAKLEETGVGGLDLSVMGVVWLGAGVMLSSMSLELAGWLSR
jgi:hypothetical protein